MTLHQAVDRIAALYDEEALLRSAARQVELEPSRREEARELFARAGGLRRARLALLNRWHLN